MELPHAIKEIIEEIGSATVPKDTVLTELKEKSAESSFELALLMLGFEDYLGFKK